MMEDDEESFVVLGTSPLSSLMSDPKISISSSTGDSIINENIKSVIEKDGLHTAIVDIQKISENLQELSFTEAEKSPNASTLTSTHSKPASDSSLAHSFILGEIDASVLKSSIYTQFPSLCSVEAEPEDLKKLQSMMMEYVELKNALDEMNVTMKSFLEKAQQWKTDVENCRVEIAILRNENMELKTTLDNKMEQIKLQEDERQKQYDELKQLDSDKVSQIQNMAAEIQKLEQMQLASYEYIPKHENDSKEKPDYISRTEHERLIKEMDRKASEMLAQNLDLKDVQTQYIDEINYMKVNLTASKELINKLNADIDFLKAKDIEKSEIFENFTKERDTMREEIAILQHQVEIYAKDFQMERTARETIAGEKDHLLQDLRILQRKNQELIEEAHKAVKVMEDKRAARSSSAVSSTSSTSNAAGGRSASSTTDLHCPICHNKFTSLLILQEHVQSCLTD